MKIRPAQVAREERKEDYKIGDILQDATRGLGVVVDHPYVARHRRLTMTIHWLNSGEQETLCAAGFYFSPVRGWMPGLPRGIKKIS